jgi:hypothetical protein
VQLRYLLQFGSCSGLQPQPSSCFVAQLPPARNIPITLDWLLGASFSGEKRDSGRRRLALMDSRTLHVLVGFDICSPTSEVKVFECLEAYLPFSSDELDCFATPFRDLFLDLGGSETAPCASMNIRCSKKNMRDGAATKGNGMLRSMRG